MISSNGSIFRGVETQGGDEKLNVDFSKWRLVYTDGITIIELNKIPTDGSEIADLNDVTIEVLDKNTGTILSYPITTFIGEPNEITEDAYIWNIDAWNIRGSKYGILYNGKVILKPFTLANIDKVREEILAAPSTAPYTVQSELPFLYRGREVTSQKFETTKPMYCLS